MKDNKKKLISIPWRLWEDIDKISDEITTTRNGTIIELLERGLAFYQKKLRKEKASRIEARLSANQVDQQKDYNENSERIQEIAKTRWVD